MNRLLSTCVFAVLAFASIPLTTIAKPPSGNAAIGKAFFDTMTNFELASYGKFNSMDAWTTISEKLYPNLKLIVKRETPTQYFAVFSASPTNDRIAICFYEKPQTKRSNGDIFDVIGKNGKSIFPNTSDEELIAKFKHQTSTELIFPKVKGGGHEEIQGIYQFVFGMYFRFKNYTGPARIELRNHVIAHFEITKPKH